MPGLKRAESRNGDSFIDTRGQPVDSPKFLLSLLASDSPMSPLRLLTLRAMTFQNGCHTHRPFISTLNTLHKVAYGLI